MVMGWLRALAAEQADGPSRGGGGSPKAAAAEGWGEGK
jgi:hypothetical protein